MGNYESQHTGFEGIDLAVSGDVMRAIERGDRSALEVAGQRHMGYYDGILELIGAKEQQQ